MCQVHFIRAVLEKVPKKKWEKIMNEVKRESRKRGEAPEVHRRT